MDLLEKVQMENLDEEQKMLAELIGLEAFKSLVRAFNGTSIYICLLYTSDAADE